MPYTLEFLILNQYFYKCLCLKIEKRFTICYVKWFSKPVHVFFYIVAFFTPGKQPHFEINDSDDHPPNTEPCTVTHPRNHWWTFDFTSNAFISLGVNSRAELVPLPGLTPGTVLHAVGSGIIQAIIYVLIMNGNSKVFISKRRQYHDPS